MHRSADCAQWLAELRSYMWPEPRIRLLHTRADRSVVRLQQIDFPPYVVSHDPLQGLLDILVGDAGNEHPLPDEELPFDVRHFLLLHFVLIPLRESGKTLRRPGSATADVHGRLSGFQKNPAGLSIWRSALAVSIFMVSLPPEQ